MRLRTAILFAKDMERMLAFYRDGVGLVPRPESSRPGWAVLDAGATQLALHAIPAGIAAGIAIADPPVAREDTPLKLVFECDDVPGARARLLAHGAVLVRGDDGRCDLLDPEGNVFQVRASGAPE